ADAPYDGEVAYVDAAIGRLFDQLQRANLFTSAAIIVVADHGESLGEHGERTHGTFLYDATVRVPLLVKLAGETASRVVAVPVEAADLAPTIAAIAGADLEAADGQDLMPLIGGNSAGDPDRPAYAESYYQNLLLGWSPLRAVRTARWKFVEAPHPELYDLEIDPHEVKNLVNDRAGLAAGLQRGLRVGIDDRHARQPRHRPEGSARGVGRDRRWPRSAAPRSPGRAAGVRARAPARPGQRPGDEISGRHPLRGGTAARGARRVYARDCRALPAPRRLR